MNRKTTTLALLGAGAVVAITFALWPTTPPEPVYKELTLDNTDEVFEHLKAGTSVIVRSKADEKGQRKEVFGVTSFGPLPMREIEAQAEKISHKLHHIREKILGAKRDYEDLTDVRDEAKDLLWAARNESMLTAFRNGDAFYGKAKVHPVLDGWFIPQIAGQTMIVDGQGRVVEDRLDGKWKRDVSIFVPIKISEYPSLQAAMDYVETCERLLGDHQVEEFNKLPLEERKAAVEQSRAAKKELYEMRKNNSNDVEKWNALLKKTLPFEVDSNWLARTQ